MLLRIFVATSVRLRRISTALGVMLAILFCTSAQAQLPNVTSGNVTLHLNADGLGPGGFGLADGAPVDTWGTDEGPVNMAIANGDVRPIFVLDAGNGHSGVQFDGTNDVLEILREVAAESIFIYAQLHVDFAATPTQQSMWLGDSDASTKVYGIRRQVAGAGQAVAFVKDEPSPGTNTPFSDTTAFHLHGWSSGSSIFIDGTDNGGASLNFSFSDKTGSGGNDDRIDLIGDERGPLADNPGPDTTFAEILLYDAPLSTPDRIAVENYFFAKYGAPLASSVGIPEPGTLTLILAALPAGMALRRRLRKRLRFLG
ncbi:MAG: PEP-CTERM sorting domain-containing protein, partial [Pirellulales bacterium]|nr:PEP-CTERM sorting domain-containing protein [Pirellulales bacterium]